jgi:hypothetical protein
MPKRCSLQFLFQTPPEEESGLHSRERCLVPLILHQVADSTPDAKRHLRFAEEKSLSL